METVSTRCKRVELAIASTHLPLFARVFETAGVTGWTALKTVGGAGTSGVWREDQLTGADDHLVVIALMDEAAAGRVLEAYPQALRALSGHRLRERCRGVASGKVRRPAVAARSGRLARRGEAADPGDAA